MGRKGRADGVSVEDAIDYQLAIESMYDIRVVMQLQTAPAGATGAWRVNAIAYERDGEGKLESAAQRMVCYPSHHHKTFGGACLNALMALEDALAATYWLQKMVPPPNP